MKKLLVSFFLLSFTFLTQAQNIKENFEVGKAYFDQEQYALAKSSFAKINALEGANDMVQWANYYYAIASYYSNDLTSAKKMFQQVLEKYPYWDVKDEVRFWLALISAEEEKLKETFDYLYRITDPEMAQDVTALKFSATSSTSDLDLLKEALAAFPTEELIASRLAELILAQPQAEQDIELLMQLEQDYELILSVALEGIEESPKKAVYNVGLFMPFYYRADSASLVRVERAWTTKLYYGVQLGVEKLKEEGVAVNLLTYDTRGLTDLESIISSGELDNLDLIIGPVTQSSITAISAFAKEKKINMINPLSANSEVINDNPFAFLYYPSNESLARRAASYAKKHFVKNKNAAVFYSGIADKARADLYKELIEKDSFNVVIHEGILPNESVKIQQLLLEEEELERDSLVVEEMMAEMDSLREAGEEDWEIYDELDFVYDTLKILPDSIGHVFVASDYSSLVTSALSGIDARPDTIEIITSSRFLAAEQSISLDQLERLDAVLMGSNFIAYDSSSVAEFRTRFLKKYLTNPSKNDILGDEYLGYDLMVNFGRLLNKYGKYFQLGLVRNADINGELIGAFNYRLTQDNNFIPYLKVRKAQIELRTEEINENQPQ